ncbi:hypothetical protein AAHC03_016656 [Spirometra sp. Aus1]
MHAERCSATRERSPQFDLIVERKAGTRSGPITVSFSEARRTLDWQPGFQFKALPPQAWLMTPRTATHRTRMATLPLPVGRFFHCPPLHNCPRGSGPEFREETEDPYSSPNR